MHCENPNCYCQSDVGLVSNGGQYCSEHCLRDDAPRQASCQCGHLGCSTAAELQSPEPQPTGK